MRRVAGFCLPSLEEGRRLLHDNVMRRVHIEIKGRVQGVQYRASAASVARDMGLAGWVRNRRDGSVEALAEGEEEIIERFVTWCRSGPPLARVDDLRTKEEEARLDPLLENGFQVLGTQ